MVTHMALALALSLFLAYQARALALVLRQRRTLSVHRRRSDLLWTAIPVLVVLFLAVRSWIAVLDLPRPAAASQPAVSAIISGVSGVLPAR